MGERVDGVIRGKVPMDDYVRDRVGHNPPTLSSSIAHVLLSRSPRHAFLKHPVLNPLWEPDDRRDFDLGTAFHAVLLEGKVLSTVPFEDYRTKAAQVARDNLKALGAIPALRWQAEAVGRMVESAHAKFMDCADLAGVVYSTLEPERTCVWTCGRVALRCRPDWLTPDRSVIVSVKTTTNAEPEAFLRGPLAAHGYDLQAAFELAAVKAICGVDAHYVYLVVECDPPYAASLIGLSPEWREFAAGKMRRAMELWGDCLNAGTWPAYPDRICYVDLPPWLQTRAVERGIVAMPAPVVFDDGRDISAQLFGDERP